MSEPPRYVDTKSDSAGLPRWVVLVAIVLAIALLLLLSLLLLGGGEGVGHVSPAH